MVEFLYGYPMQSHRQKFLLSAATLLIISGAGSAALAAAPAADMQRCAKITNAGARLACYDKAMAPAKTTTPKQAAPLATHTAKPATGAEPAASHATPTLPAAQTTAAQFGSEQLDEPATAHHKKKALDKINGVIKSHTMTPFGKFTITLTNGQVWKQYQGDSGRPAIFPHRRNVHVTISRGLFGSYNLTIEGSDLVYKVKRIQ